MAAHFASTETGYTLKGYRPSDSIQLSPSELTDESAKGLEFFGCLIGMCILFKISASELVWCLRCASSF